MNNNELKQDINTTLNFFDNNQLIKLDLLLSKIAILKTKNIDDILNELDNSIELYLNI